MGEGAQGRGRITHLLASHGVKPRRSLGQHFLADPNTIAKMIRLAEIEPGDRVLEVGAGTGTLTAALASAGAQVLAYEVDERLAPLLEEVVGGDVRVEVRFEDAAAVEWDLAGRWAMVSNLPYHTGTPILLDLLRTAPQVDRMVVMVQQEVGERLVSPPGRRSYGFPSVVAQLHADGEIVMRVGPQVFVPPPPVRSCVVRLRRRPAPADTPRALELARVAFGQRRKMLRRALGEVVTEAQLEAAGLEPSARAGDVSPEGFLRLARVERAGRLS